LAGADVADVVDVEHLRTPGHAGLLERIGEPRRIDLRRLATDVGHVLFPLVPRCCGPDGSGMATPVSRSRPSRAGPPLSFWQFSCHVATGAPPPPDRSGRTVTRRPGRTWRWRRVRRAARPARR